MALPNLLQALITPNVAACAVGPGAVGPGSMMCPVSAPSDGCSRRSIPKNSKPRWSAGWSKRIPPGQRSFIADGKVLKNAEPAPARCTTTKPVGQPEEPCEIPEQLQKPKADKALTLVNFQTTEQRLIDQIAVPSDTNEEAAVAAHLAKMDLAGICLTTDAAHLTKANCRQLTQNNGAEFLLFLKANQPTALAKAEQLLLGKVPPSGQHAG